MRLGPDLDQQELAGAFRSFCDKECSAQHIRDAWDGDRGWSTERWKRLAEIGVLGVRVPEAYGGMGLSDFEMALIAEEAGRVALPEPLVDTAAVGAGLLDDLDRLVGWPPAPGWLERVASGDAVVAVGTLDSSVASPGILVHAAGEADLVLLAAPDAIWALDPADCVTEVRRGLDGTRRFARVDLGSSRALPVVSGEQFRSISVAVTDRGATATAAMLVGLGAGMLDMAVSYAGQRRQFGRQIGSFQAVKHQLADVAVRVEFARPAVWRAAASGASGDATASRDASVAKALASQAALLASRTALQVHGAVGYTSECDLHLWAKRAWSLASAWGDVTFHRRRVLASLVPDPAPPLQGQAQPMDTFRADRGALL